MSVVIFKLEIFCPNCGERHVDKDEWENRAHETHLCEHCEHGFTVTASGVPEGAE